MEALLEGTLFSLLRVPNMKIRKPAWVVQPSPMVVFVFCLFSYFLVTAGHSSLTLRTILEQSKSEPNPFHFCVPFHYAGVIYDVIVEPPGVGSTVDERGVSRPVRIFT